MNDPRAGDKFEDLEGALEAEADPELIGEPEGEILEVRIPEGSDGVRADRVLAGVLKAWSREQLKGSFEAGQVWRGAQVLNRRTPLFTGDLVTLIPPRPPDSELVPVPMALDILWEDEHLVVVNKPSGLVVHPGSGTDQPTLVHGLLHHTGGHLAGGGGELRPGVVHRLDKETSGVLVAAKSNTAYLGLTRAFAKREVKKYYLALVEGSLAEPSGTIRRPIGRHPVHRTRMAVVEGGRPAWTDYRSLECFGSCATLVGCDLHTGRTHQIRVHLSALGHPIVGDGVYGYARRRSAGPQPPYFLLHAAKIGFQHPVEGTEIRVEAPLSDHFSEWLVRLREQFGGDAETQVVE